MADSFGTWLKQRRIGLGLSQKELAQKVGCSAALIRKMEADERRPSRQMAELLIQPLGVEADDKPSFLQFVRRRTTEETPDRPSSVSLLSPLTRREQSILGLILQDVSDADIAESLSLKIGTVRWYVKQIYSKLSVHSRDEAIQRASEVGWMTTASPISAGRFEFSIPPIRSTPRLIHTLPQDVHERYVGRDHEVGELLHLLRTKARLMSIYGRSGIGKTALASKVLTDLLRSENRPDGIVSLGATTTGISLPQVLTSFAKLLGGQAEERLALMAQDGQVMAAARITLMLEYLRQGWYILLLDNLETLQASETGELTDRDIYTLFQIVIEQGGLTILVTSQVQLTLARPLLLSERQFPLHEGLVEEDAVTLLRRLDHDGVVGLRDASDILLRRCIQRTHGYPRALEAVMGMLLEDPLLTLDSLLGDGTRLSSEVTLIVQQSIRGLDPAALQVMQVLSIFQRSVPLQALEYVLEPFVETAALRATLSRLVRAYFVGYNRANQQFSLHPIDHDYCYGQIPLSADAKTASVFARNELHQRAADYFRRQRQPPGEWRHLDDLIPVLDEYDHRLQAAEYDEAARLLLMIDRDYLWEWGQKTLLQSLHERLHGKIVDGYLARQHLRRLGWLAWQETDRAIQYFQQVLHSAREAGDRLSEADALDDLAQVARKRSNTLEGLRYHQQALTLYREIGDKRGLAEALGGIGTILAFVDPEPALSAFTEALEIHRQNNNIPSLAYVLRMLGTIHKNLGEYDAARATCVQALDLCQQHRLKKGEAGARLTLAAIEADLGNYAALVQCSHELLSIGQELSDLYFQSAGLQGLGRAKFVLGQHEEGIADLYQALEHARDEGRHPQIAYVGVMLAGCLLDSDNDIEAAAVLTAIEPYAPFFPTIWMMFGLIDARAGDYARALEKLRQLIGFSERFPRQGRRMVWEQYAMAFGHTAVAFLSGDDLTPSLMEYREAVERCSAGGVVADQVSLLEALMKCPQGERLQPIYAILTGKR